MIITDTTIVNEALADILAKKSMIAIDAKDVVRLFGDNPKLRMMKVCGNTVDDVIINLKKDLAEIGGYPEKFLAAYVSMILRMSDLELLSELTDSASNYKRTIIFETAPEGNIVLYYFY